MSHLIRGVISLRHLSKSTIQRFSSAAYKPMPFMERDRKGKAKIPAGVLLPHQIIAPAFHTPYENIEEDVKMAELRWQRMVSDLYSMGKLRNSIAVYHLSEKMSERTKQVCVAMALLISELSDAPWKGKVFAFHQDPYIMDIEGKSILDKAKFLKDYYNWWYDRLDYAMVFRDILKVAREAKLKHSEMIERVFVFSDLTFHWSSYYYQKIHLGTENCGDGDSWKYEYRMLREMFPKGGYAMPKIVFWELQEYFPEHLKLKLYPSMVSNVKKHPGMPKGVTKNICGMSDDLLKQFLENDAVRTKKPSDGILPR